MEARWSVRGMRLSGRGIALLLGAFLAVLLWATTAQPARASFYDVVFCASGNGSGNPTLGARPGFFDFDSNCDYASGYPAGSSDWLRLNENTTGAAGYNDEASMSWYTPPWVSIVAGGGYTREAYSFNQGWRARFWGEDWGGGIHNILLQGTGIEGTGAYPWITKNTTSIFASHLWPFSGWDDYKRFVFALWCVRSAGCDRTNYNAVDANTITLVANDKKPPEVGFVDSAIVRGEWVRGYQVLAWNEHDEGSGLRFSRLGVDGGVFGDGTIDYQANGGCRIGYRDGGQEFGKSLDPCVHGPYLRYYGFETKNISDGQHVLAICLQDYSQYLHGENSCDRRTIHTDNTPPGKPASLTVASANPARYLDHFDASWSLPPNQGSPITKVHYDIVNAANEVVVPERTVSGTNPSSLSNIEGPTSPGAYTLRLWLEDQVGFVGPAAEVPIPHDTTPPAAPQELRVTGPSTAHWVDKVDVRWRDIVDEGSPIDAVHYQVVDASGAAVGPAQTVVGQNIEALSGIESPAQRGDYTLRVWLSDEEGNVGAPASVAFPRDTTPPAAPQDISVAAPSQSRAAQGIDVRWRNIVDEGSPIDAVHYQVLNGKGAVAVSTQTVDGENIQAITSLDTPKERGSYSLRMWLSDAEGNVGAPVSVPLSYQCVRSDSDQGAALSAGLGSAGSRDQVVQEGEGSTVHGVLKAADGRGVAKAPLCVFSRVVTDQERRFLGFAVTGSDGSYRFPIDAGASREVSVIHRRDHREVQSQATLETVVHPTFKARRRIVYNKHFARFKGHIPGPHNDRVVIVLQARVGKGWTAFRRYRTRDNGRFNLAYRFRHTFRKTRYVMRAQVRQTVGYPYLQGNSRHLKLMVLPRRRGRVRTVRRGAEKVGRHCLRHSRRCTKRRRHCSRRRRHCSKHSRHCSKHSRRCSRHSRHCSRHSRRCNKRSQHRGR